MGGKFNRAERRRMLRIRRQLTLVDIGYDKAALAHLSVLREIGCHSLLSQGVGRTEYWGATITDEP